MPPDDARFASVGARPQPKAGLLEIAPYVGGKAKAAGFAHPLKLSSNENPLGCSPFARAAFTGCADQLSLYPDGRAEALRTAVAARYGLAPDRLTFGCGSDEVFGLLAQVYLEPGDNAVQAQYGFLAYRIAVRAAQAQIRFAPQPQRRLDVDSILRCIDERTRLVFLDNPGNPTGAWLPPAEVRRLHRALPAQTLLVLDEAYAEFVDTAAADDGFELAHAAQNVVVARTFSKIHGLAALRVGWAYGPEDVVAAVERIRPPFNVNLPAQAAATAALGDADFVARSRELVRAERPRLERSLAELGLAVDPGQGNFVLVRFPHAPHAADDAEVALAAEGVLVRGLRNYAMPDSLRITVGLPDDNTRVIEVLRRFLAR